MNKNAKNWSSLFYILSGTEKLLILYSCIVFYFLVYERNNYSNNVLIRKKILLKMLMH